MILDALAAAEPYFALHRGFSAAFAYLRSVSPGQLLEGRHELEGNRLFALVAHDSGRGRQAAKLEVHRKFIDIQCCLSGQESIGWRPLADCAAPEAPFDSTRDIQFFADRPESWLDLHPGRFAIFYPSDAHAPLAGDGEVLKVVVKVAVDWAL
ncbi:MAG TPA: YhcH/YjgK/YiaL family protein [Pirellulales bacterium]|jgi:YhcH/YjgK/YiaL family protein|nr:YhcH/YjgK/YiaL family protein [Pirellulales bacterium]